MKRSKKKILVFTDGKYFFENASAMESYFTDNVKEARNFHCDRWTELNKKETLLWEIDTHTKHQPIIHLTNEYGKVTRHTDDNFDWNKFNLKWVTIIETIKEEDFNYEGFN